MNPDSEKNTAPATFASNSAPELLLPPGKKRSSFFETIKFILLAIAIVLPIRLFIAQPFIVDGLSMYPTFNDRDYLIVDEISYRFENPSRGDVVVFQYPCPNAAVATVGECPNPIRYYIKRIIGVPGDTVIATAGKGVTIKNAAHPGGETLAEPYISEEEAAGTYPDITTTLGPDEYFVMGDNRPHSSDSRIWGVLKRSYLVGRPLVRLFPLGSVGVFPGEKKVGN